MDMSVHEVLQHAHVAPLDIDAILEHVDQGAIVVEPTSDFPVFPEP
jgi:hypothetical protein